MTQGFGASVQDMHRAARQVRAVNTAVQSELTSLRGRLAPLSAAWRGEAATAFTALMQRWDSDARQLNEALRGIGDAISGSGVSYQSQDDQHAQALSTIRAALG